MKKITYYLVLPFIYIIAILPMWVLYGFSDLVLFPIIYWVLGYRKQVVKENLYNSFPEKDANELLKIEKKFYHYLCDLFVEQISNLTISEKAIRKRFFFKSENELIDKWYAERRDFVMSIGHFGNFEWFGMAMTLHFKYICKFPYHELSNPYFDKLVLRGRSKFGSSVFPTYKTARELQHDENNPFMMVLANDQSSPPLQSYWTTFLNQDTCFFWGTDKIARKKDMPVLFAAIKRVKRGYYEVDFKLITDSPKSLAKGEIIEIHAKLLEEQIRAEPEFWLWSHKRWKHKRP